MWFSKETFLAMLANGWIVDARGGGLVLGRSHADGNIYIIQELDDGRFHLPASMEGGEYILNHDSYHSHKDRVLEINSFKDEHDSTTSINITKNTKILNTHSNPSDKLLWIDISGQFIISKTATAKHLEELETINAANNNFLTCDLDNMIPKEITE